MIQKITDIHQQVQKFKTFNAFILSFAHHACVSAVFGRQIDCVVGLLGSSYLFYFYHLYLYVIGDCVPICLVSPFGLIGRGFEHNQGCNVHHIYSPKSAISTVILRGVGLLLGAFSLSLCIFALIC